MNLTGEDDDVAGLSRVAKIDRSADPHVRVASRKVGHKVRSASVLFLQVIPYCRGINMILIPHLKTRSVSLFR